MDFPKIGNLNKLVIDDKLHIAAIDFIFTELAPRDMISVQGVTKKNNRWALTNGLHNINYGMDESFRACYIHVNREKDICLIEFFGDEPTKTINKVITAKRIGIMNETFIREIDMYIMKEKNMMTSGGFNINIVPSPMDDIYVFNKKNEKGYMIINKITEKDKQSYVIDVVGDYYNNIIQSILTGNGDRIKVIKYSVVGRDNLFARTLHQIPLPIDEIYRSTQTIVDYVIKTYNASHNKNLTILISGPSGLGKSTVAFWIAQLMKKDLVDPFLIKGFNVNCAEMQYDPIINHYSPESGSPAILLLDEFDIAMERAEKTDPTNDAHAISANKTNLNNFLDSINEEQFLVTVVTTNKLIKEIRDKFSVYCRKGRFQKHFEIISKDEVNILDPF